MTTPDVPHRFEIELSVPGTPEEVWRAISTGEGVSAWMMPSEIDARAGGSVVFHMGPDDKSEGRITEFDAPHRLAYEEDWATLMGHPGADVTPLVTEFLVEAQSGGTCVVRVVTSAFGTGADWENEFWADMLVGWGPMLDNLRLYLTHFPGQHATSMWASATFETASPDAAIVALRDALGVHDVGSSFDARGVAGRVERAMPRHFMLRLETPVPGFMAFSSVGDEHTSLVHLNGYLFSPSAADYVEREHAGWQDWMNGVAAAAAPGQGAR